MPKVTVIESLSLDVLFEDQVSATWQLPNKSDVIVIDEVGYDIVEIYHMLKEDGITVYVNEGDA